MRTLTEDGSDACITALTAWQCECGVGRVGRPTAPDRPGKCRLAKPSEPSTCGAGISSAGRPTAASSSSLEVQRRRALPTATSDRVHRDEHRSRRDEVTEDTPVLELALVSEVPGAVDREVVDV